MTCGKDPCNCMTEKVYIPFMGGGESITNDTSADQLAAFIKLEDRVPILLALSLYSGQPRTNLAPQLIESSVTPRTACWVFENTIIVGTRGTCIGFLVFKKGCEQENSDIADDKVRFIKHYPDPPKFSGFLAVQLIEQLELEDRRILYTSHVKVQSN